MARKSGAEKTTGDYDRGKLEEHLAKLSSGVRVGAPTEAEMKAKKEEGSARRGHQLYKGR